MSGNAGAGGAKDMAVTVIGGGLAGAEAAYALARRGLAVRLIEMRPERNTPAHRTGLLAELVCSNSLKSESMATAPGLLKAEMRLLGSLVMEAADASRVPAGGALAVDRAAFSERITERIESLPGVEIVRTEAERLPEDGLCIVAAGPLCSDALAKDIERAAGLGSLSFYDAIAPIVHVDSIDMAVAFRASRYGKGGADYINCPMDRDEYEAFLDALIGARRTASRDFESVACFEGCLPVEVMAERGRDTLAHGPLKPVGLADPRTGRRPHAVVQLRQDNKEGTLYNMVGFQTRLAHPEQERVFRMIPGLGNADFARLGGAHRNTFIDSPRLLLPSLEFRARPGLFFAGQITGVEGYLASAATGILAGLNAARSASGEDHVVPPAESMLGGLVRYVTDPEREDFQPMAPNFGLVPRIEGRMKKAERKEAMAHVAIAAMERFVASERLP